VLSHFPKSKIVGAYQWLGEVSATLSTRRIDPLSTSRAVLQVLGSEGITVFGIISSANVLSFFMDERTVPKAYGCVYDYFYA